MMTHLKIYFFLIIGLACFITTVSVKLLISLNINENNLNIYKTLAKLLNKCYHDNLNPLIMSNVMNQQLREYSSLEYPMSLILMDENFNHNEAQAQWTNYYPNLATFVLIVYPLDRFEITLKKIFYSVWNDNEPNFILVSLDSCQNVQLVLSMLWIKNFLSAIFLCHNDLDDVIQLYTFNPFADRAPYPWIKVWNNHTWTLYQRNHQEDENMCLNLNYDKTKYFDGYKIKALGIPKPGVTWIDDMDYDVSSLTEKLPYFNAQFALNIFLLSNITPIINYNRSLQLLVKHQFFLTSFYPSQFDKSVYESYPFRQTSAVIITQKRPFLSAEDKILSFYSVLFIFLVIICFGTLFIALMLNKKQPWLSAVMELMRLLVFTSILQPLNKLPLRIYLFGILWLVIILNATFQGNLEKFLTRPERQSIDTIADLKNFKYKVYVHSGIFPSVSITLSVMQLSTKIIDDLNGYEVVLNDSRAAYIAVDFRAYEPAYKHQLHVSNPCGSSYQFFITSLPIIKRINEITSRYAESGLQNYWDKFAIDRYKINLTNTEEWETSPQIRPITINDTLFMFKFLAIGLGISFVVFLREVAVGRKYKKHINKCHIAHIDFTL